ncbi:MAG: glycosyl hydrolase family 18 protein [Solirubrobacteraceae bacterium]
MAIAVCVGCWGSQTAGAAAGASGRAGAGTAKGAAAETLAVTAWLPYWEMSAALRSTLENSGVIGTASPYWYDISGDSHVHEEQGAGSQTVISELLAHHEQLLPMVTEASGINEFARILESPAKRTALVRTLVKLASHSGYSGLDIDFESFAYDPRHRTALDDQLATLFPEMISQTCVALHAIGRGCQVAVMARTSDARTYAHGDIPTWIYNYRALAAAADRIQVMAYDYHSPGGPSGPIAPLPWVKQVIAYARTQGSPSRFELGVPAYGYDWYGRTSATAVYAGQVGALLAQVHTRPHWDPVDGEETFSYRLHHRRHTVWVVNAQADAERAKLAAVAGFSGVAVWAAGYEQPQLWSGLDQSTPR